MSDRPVIELHVEELVLHGFRPGDRWAIGDAVEGELARVLAGRDVGELPTMERTVGRVDAGSFAVPAAAPPAAVGAGVAGAVFQALR